LRSGRLTLLSGYRTVWRGLVLAVAAVGWGGAVILMQTSALVAVLATAAVVCVLATAGLLGARPPVIVTKTTALRRCVINGLLGAAAATAVAGLGVLLGVTVLVVLLLIAVTAPPVVEFAVRRFLRAQAAPDAQAIAALSVARRPLAQLSEAELCAAWTSSWHLLRSGAPAQRLACVQARQHYLDELERRDAAGLRAWLASCASPAGDPRPFISSPRRRDPDDGR
jgi:hypothetical protein